MFILYQKYLIIINITRRINNRLKPILWKIISQAIFTADFTKGVYPFLRVKSKSGNAPINFKK